MHLPLGKKSLGNGHRLRWFALFICAIIPLPAFAVEVTPVKEQVKAIAKRYDQVEEQLSRSVRYAERKEMDGGVIVTQAWFNAVHDLLKVTVERTNPQGRELTEYVAIDPDAPYFGLFVLTRKETPANDSGTDVEESRRYYGVVAVRDRSGGETTENGVLLRELKKSAHFAPGEPLDTGKVPNTSVPVPKVSQETELTADEVRAKAKRFNEPMESGYHLQETTAPATDPFAEVKGDSDRFRLIRGSASPDGRYALAIGFEQPVDWSKIAEQKDGEVEIYNAEYEKGLCNYLVEIATKRILGTTGGSYFGTRQRYSLLASGVVWSDDSSTFVQKVDSKWSTESCHVARVRPGPKWVGVVDLQKPAEQHAQRFLKAKGRKYRGAIALSIEEVNADGTIVLIVTGQSSSGENKGETYFEVEETLRLSEKAGQLKLQLLKAKLLPND